ncbi:MAG: PilZ domain-containing protein [Chitinophagaceae bacterium]|nr:PilZ domain-containing protein [Chitinophagaceae bacterium]
MPSAGPGFGAQASRDSGDGQIPRREPRFVVPAISISIQVDLLVPPDLFVGRLWDVSQSGACLLFPARCQIQPGMAGALTIHHPSVGSSIHTRAVLLWTDRLNTVVYAGAFFQEPVRFEQTFLSMLMRSARTTSSLPQLFDPHGRPDALPGGPP